MPSRTPHDTLFRAVFGQIQNAADELSHALPKDLVAVIDWSTLQLTNSHFVDERLAQRESDLLFSAQARGHDLNIFLLLEHQSTVDAMMLLRALGYMNRIWEPWIASHPGGTRPPIVVPAVMTHAEGGWHKPRTLHELFELDPALQSAIGRYIPNFELVIDDVALDTDEQLQKRPMRDALATLTLLLFRHAHRPKELIRLLPSWNALLDPVWNANDGGRGASLVKQYVASVAPKKHWPQNIDETMKEQFSPALVDIVKSVIVPAMMDSWADDIREETRAKVLAETCPQIRAETRVEDILAILRVRGIAVSEEQVQYIRACSDLNVLQRWTERAVTAQSTDDLFID